MAAIDDLAEADRVGDRHHDDFADNLAALLGGVELAQQMMRREHAGDFIGMERGLEIGLGPRALGAVAVDAQEPFRAGAHAAQRDPLDRFRHDK